MDQRGAGLTSRLMIDDVMVTKLNYDRNAKL
jgi:hypothetical protein